MFNVLPPIDERFELAMITMGAGWVIIGQIGPMFRAWRKGRNATKIKAILAAEADLNETIATAVTAFKAGSEVPAYIRVINAGERGLRAVEAEAATMKIACAQRDALVEQLNYLVAVASAGSAETEAAVLKAARAAVESSLEKDSSLQQKTIAGAIAALASGNSGDDSVAVMFSDAVKKARAGA